MVVIFYLYEVYHILYDVLISVLWFVLLRYGVIFRGVSKHVLVTLLLMCLRPRVRFHTSQFYSLFYTLGYYSISIGIFLPRLYLNT